MARGIREEVLEGRMPPWSPATGFGDFSNDRSLSPVERELLTAWADGDTPLGVPAAPVVAEPRRPAGAVLRVPFRQINEKRMERVEVPAGNSQAQWISGWRFAVDDASMVERVGLSVVSGGFLGSWVPGDGPVRLPAGVAQRLPPRASLALEFYYAKSPPRQMPPATLELSFGPAPSRTLRQRTLRCDANRLAEGVEVVAVTPLASGAGDPVEVVAHTPDGSVEPLLVITQFNPGDPVTYRFRKPVPLPPGSLLTVRSPLPGCRVELEFISRRLGRAAAPSQ